MSVRSLDNAPRGWYGYLAEEATSVTLPGCTEIALVRSPQHPSWHWDAQTADAAPLVNLAASHVTPYVEKESATRAVTGERPAAIPDASKRFPPHNKMSPPG